ncbi:MAG TPA: hypothetical protein VJJ24_02945 [Candidatus Paceibacterota bacterium]
MIDGINHGGDSVASNATPKKMNGREKLFLIIAVVIIIIVAVLFLTGSKEPNYSDDSTTARGGDVLSQDEKESLIDSTSAPSGEGLTTESQADLEARTTAQ